MLWKHSRPAKLSFLQITLLNQYLQAVPPPHPNKNTKPFGFYLSLTKISFQYKILKIYWTTAVKLNKKTKKRDKRRHKL